MVRYYTRPMEPRNVSSPGRRHRLLRWLGAALAFSLAGYSLYSYAHLRHLLEEYRLQAVAAGFADDSTLLKNLAGEADPHRAALLLARAILARDLAPEPSVPRGSELERARVLALEALGAHPAAWQAPMTLGAATYLEWSIARDGRLFRESDQWQIPLLRSLELAPGRNEPTQFLASAYLELWPALSEPRKEEARKLVGRAMEDPAHFSRLLEPWLSRAQDREEAFALIPDDPHAWQVLGRHYSDQRDWRAFVAVQTRGFEARRARARALLEEGQQRLSGRDFRAARHLLLSAVMTAPGGLEMDPLVEEALDLAPAGPYNPHYSKDLRRQLERALDLYLHRTAPLPPKTVARLAVASGDLPAEQAALAALASGDLAEAELIARREGAPSWDPQWSPYRIARGRVLLERGDLGGAEASLHEAHAGWRRQPVYWRLQKELAARNGQGEVVAQAEAELRKLSAEERGASDWQALAEDQYRLIWWQETAATALTLEISPRLTIGGAVEVVLNGDLVGYWPLPSRSLEIEVDAPGQEIHLLEIRKLAGGGFVPGRLRATSPPF